ncbi:hypothetical protein COV16_06415 [Candidatus Woesearchaeota archaeon CG10_big_fil_rev_8_21_14_0_10_34_8]|nr:MAG: hypothetical protein COV16_06415 [Candidatus Woesearchaeota archaeon CG10_big_fil_rev_8_21_14_0_10_34_8]
MGEDALVAIIGGSGVDKCPVFDGAKWEQMNTKYIIRFPDSDETTGIVHFQRSLDRDVIFIPRHGVNLNEKSGVVEAGLYRYPPSRTQYAANLIAAHMLGARVVVATSAVGTYRPEKAGVQSLVVPHDYIDESGRDPNLFGTGLTLHLNRRPPFDEGLRTILLESGEDIPDFIGIHDTAVYVVIPGDDFGTSAEGKKRMNYADIPGMTAMPEAAMAMRMGMRYAIAAFPVDVDSDASHESATGKVMAALGGDDGIPLYLSRVLPKAVTYAKSVLNTPIPNFESGCVIPTDVSRIKHEYLRQIAAEHVAKYANLH